MVRSTDSPPMTIAVDWNVKQQKQTKIKMHVKENNLQKNSDMVNNQMI